MGAVRFNHVTEGTDMLRILVILFILMASTAQAKVVGTLGQTWPIAEKDFLQVIENRLKEIDWQEKLQELKAEAQRKLRSYSPPNAVKLPPAKKARAYRVDLTYTLPFDIRNTEGQILYPKGYKFNPLALFRAHKIVYPYALVVINGNREAEVEWFRKNLNDNHRVKLLITEGPVFELAEKLKRPVFFLNRLIQARLRIEETPSIVAQEGDYMLVRVIHVSDKK